MAMKLFYSPIHGFIHKVLVTAHEAGVWDRLEFVPVYPIQDGYSIAAINPLHKVPTLALDDGTVFYGSQTVVEYLDSLSTTGKHLYPAAGPARWDALRRLALADTLFEVTVVMALERLEKPPREIVFKWNWAKVVRAVDQMEADAAKGFASFDIGQASALHGLSYLDRQTSRGLHPPVPEGLELAGWPPGADGVVGRGRPKAVRAIPLQQGIRGRRQRRILSGQGRRGSARTREVRARKAGSGSCGFRAAGGMTPCPQRHIRISRRRFSLVPSRCATGSSFPAIRWCTATPRV